MSKESHLLRNTHAIKGLKQFQDSVVLSAETPLRHMLSSEAGEGVTYQYAGISSGMVRFSVAVPIPEVDLRKVQQYDALKKVISEILNAIGSHLIWFVYNPDNQEENEARKISIQALYGYYNHIAFFAPDFTKSDILHGTISDIWTYARGYKEDSASFDRSGSAIRPFVKRVVGKDLGSGYSKFISSIWRSHALPMVTANTRREIVSLIQHMSRSIDPLTLQNALVLNRVGFKDGDIPESLLKTFSPQCREVLTETSENAINFKPDQEGFCCIQTEVVNQILAELLPEEGYASRPTLRTLIGLAQKMRVIAKELSHDEASWRFFFVLTLIYRGIEVPSILYSDTSLFD